MLVANITDLSKDLSPSVNHWKVTGSHIGAGQSTAVLTPEVGRTFFENGTDDNIGIATDGGRYPWGLTIIRPSPDSTGPDNIEWVGIQIGLAPKGVGILTDNATSPQVYVPGSGTFVVCNETNPVYGRPQYPVKFVRTTLVDGAAHQDIPALCAPITLLAQCATLDPLEGDAEYDHEYAQASDVTTMLPLSSGNGIY